MGRTLRSVSPRRLRARVAALAGVVAVLAALAVAVVQGGRTLLVQGEGVREAGGADDVGSDGVRSARREAGSR